MMNDYDGDDDDDDDDDNMYDACCICFDRDLCSSPITTLSLLLLKLI